MEAIDSVSSAIARVFPLGSSGGASGVGTGFAVCDGSFLVTAAHVVDGASAIQVLGKGPPTWHTEATLVKICRFDDVAVLALSSPAPFQLRLATPEGIGQIGPAVCWGDAAGLDEDVTHATFTLSATPMLAVDYVSMTTLGGARRLALAGSVKKGMSGGPVYSLELDAVVGLVSEIPQYDPDAIADAWELTCRPSESLTDELATDVRELLRAHLTTGIGVAVPADRIVAAVDDARSQGS